MCQFTSELYQQEYYNGRIPKCVLAADHELYTGRVMKKVENKISEEPLIDLSSYREVQTTPQQNEDELRKTKLDDTSSEDDENWGDQAKSTREGFYKSNKRANMKVNQHQKAEELEQEMKLKIAKKERRMEREKSGDRDPFVHKAEVD